MNDQQPQPPPSLDQPEPFDYKRWRNFYELLSGAAVVALLIGIGVLIFSNDLPQYWQNIYITGVGAALTVTVIDIRARQRSKAERKQELIAQMGSPSNDFALEAVRLLRNMGALHDGSMRGVNLQSANLTSVNLYQADLRDTKLWQAKFQGASMIETNFQGALLSGCDFQNAKLIAANLRNAEMILTNLTGSEMVSTDFRGACLHHAILVGSNLRDSSLQSTNLTLANFDNAILHRTQMQGAIMTGATLKGADLADAQFSPETILPDGTHWTPGRDLRQFTHPDEWQAEQVPPHTPSD